MKQFLAPSTLLLVVLLFPGLSGVTHANHQDPEGPRKQEESPGRGTNRSHPLHYQVKRYLGPRQPPFPGDVPPGIRNIICLMQHGTCRLFFCRSGEKKSEICSDPWNRCCIPHSEEEKKYRPEMDGDQAPRT
ncbi:sperm-associated antigen 11B-like [Odocoileus virginianus]|uniref:Sperm-associated antigen 11B-like n=1 Tax=Odocoileus virginianus TaxID=9874 RepID=A0ABM4HKZ0_ODOVR